MSDPIAKIEYDLSESPEWVGDEADDTLEAMNEDARRHLKKFHDDSEFYS